MDRLPLLETLDRVFEDGGPIAAERLDVPLDDQVPQHKFKWDTPSREVKLVNVPAVDEAGIQLDMCEWIAVGKTLSLVAAPRGRQTTEAT